MYLVLFFFKKRGREMDTADIEKGTKKDRDLKTEIEGKRDRVRDRD